MEVELLKTKYQANFLYSERDRLGNGSMSEPYGTIHYFKFDGMHNPIASQFLAEAKKVDAYKIVTSNQKQLIQIHIK